MFGVTWYLQHTTLHLCPQAWSCRLWYGEAYQPIESGMLLWRRLRWPNKKTGHEVPSKPVGATSPQPLCIIHLLSVVAPINRLMYQLLLLILLFISFEKNLRCDLYLWFLEMVSWHPNTTPAKYAGGTIDGRFDEKDGDVHRRNHGWRQRGAMCFFKG